MQTLDHADPANADQFGRVTMPGVIRARSKLKKRPVPPHPTWMSSTINTIAWRSATVLQAAKPLG
jgi:hypothetical protein